MQTPWPLILLHNLLALSSLDPIENVVHEQELKIVNRLSRERRRAPSRQSKNDLRGQVRHYSSSENVADPILVFRWLNMLTPSCSPVGGLLQPRCRLPLALNLLGSLCD